MTTQEQQMLQDLTARINNTQLPEKDPDAERFLEDTLGRNPDALYIMAQTLLVQQYALDNAQKQLADQKTQIATLSQQTQQPKHSTSFLGNLLGMNDTPPPSPQPQYAPVQNYPPQQYQQPQYGAPQYGAPQYGAPQYGGGYPPPQQGGGFLRSAMTTATGVAAGALAFEGIESLMHGFGGHQNYGQGFGGFEGGNNRPEEIVNNYYGDSGHGNSGNLGSDIEDRRGDNNDTRGVADTSGFDDNSNYDNNTTADDTDYGTDSNDSGDSGSGDDSSNYG